MNRKLAIILCLFFFLIGYVIALSTGTTDIPSPISKILPSVSGRGYDIIVMENIQLISEKPINKTHMTSTYSWVNENYQDATGKGRLNMPKRLYIIVLNSTGYSDVSMIVDDSLWQQLK